MLFLNPDPSTTANISLLDNRKGAAVYIDQKPDALSYDHPNEISNTSPSEPIVRHPEFFFENTLIAIKVENTLFNVHKDQLAKSEVFSKMFKMPKARRDGPEEGILPENPIVIHGASASDFAALLKVLYANHSSSGPRQPLSHDHEGPTHRLVLQNPPLIVPAFRLAHILNFSELREYLLPFAGQVLGEVDKIVLARQFGIEEWLASAFFRLCKQDNVLSTEEARKLDVESVLFLWRVREKYRERTMDFGYYYCEECAGMAYDDDDGDTCRQCNSRYGRLYCNRPGPMSGSKIDSEIEAEVKKWLEDEYNGKS